MERIFNVTKKLIVEQKKTLLILSGGYLGGCAALGLWLGFLEVGVNNDFFIMFALISGLLASIVASKMWFELTTKEGRISLLMTPASAAQQFWPRFIGVFPGMIILCIIGYLIFAYSDILAFGITYGTWNSLDNPFSDTLGRGNNALWICWITACVIFSEGMYILGSALWPRRSFLKTSAICFALQIVLSFVVMFIVSHIHGMRLIITDPNAIAWTFTGIVGALGILMIWGSYVKYKRTYVV